MFMRRVNPYGIRRGRGSVAGTRPHIRDLDSVASVEFQQPLPCRRLPTLNQESRRAARTSNAVLGSGREHVLQVLGQRLAA